MKANEFCDFAWFILDATPRTPVDTEGVPLHGKLLKSYRITIFGITMVVIQCPHCGKNVELEDGASGLFDCPQCEQDFSYGNDDTALPPFRHSQLFMSRGMKIGLAIIALGVISIIGLSIASFWGALDGSYGWGFIPCGICAIGIPIVVISFFVRGYQLNWEV